MYKKWYPHILIFLLLLSSGLASAQQLMMEEIVESSPGNSLFGQNKRHFLETRLFYGLMYNRENHAYPVKLLGSGEFEALVHYKLKINPMLSTGMSAAYFNQLYKVNHEDYPDDIFADRELFKINSLKPAIFLRLNIDPKRGNYLGKYIETGLYGSWSFSLKRVLLY